jgi:predicted nucleic acid-binding protein
MEDKIFLDTNILIYAYSKTELDKRKIAHEILRTKTFVISTQVINEFIWVMCRKYQVEKEKLQMIGNRFLKMFEVVIINLHTIQKALNIFTKYNYSYWDSLIIASAIENGCSILYTEDMQTGQVLEGKLKIVNPFAYRK